jgi:O-glycosyl hydrolase
MSSAGKIIQVQVNATQAFQTLDGFGVNINSKMWQPRLLPAMDLLLNDLGATLYRLDIFGKSNWLDPASRSGPSSLEPARLGEIYQGEIAGRGWGMLRYLNAHGIEPYLTASGDVPAWMLAPDGKTLADYESFSEMMVSLVDWAVHREGLKIGCFGPLNETDIGSPEGPRVLPQEYPKVLEILDRKLTERGLDVPLVVPEQGHFNASYIRQIAARPALAGRIGVFATHCYTDISQHQFAEVRAAASTFPNAHLWMGEYGDLDQSGEKEWYVAWVMTLRLLDLLENGYHGALVWDAFDNYHDHDEHWTIYGLLRTGLRAYTPKKRYHAAKQVFRFVKPGFQRLMAEANSPDVRILAFASPDRTQVVAVGVNLASQPRYLNIWLEGFPETVSNGRVVYYRTSETENCHRIGEIPVRGGNWPFTGIDGMIPGDSIFTFHNEDMC